MSHLRRHLAQRANRDLNLLLSWIAEIKRWDGRTLKFPRTPGSSWGFTLGDGKDGWLFSRRGIEADMWEEFGPRVTKLHKDMLEWMAKEYETRAEEAL